MRKRQKRIILQYSYYEELGLDKKKLQVQIGFMLKRINLCHLKNANI